MRNISEDNVNLVRILVFPWGSPWKISRDRTTLTNTWGEVKYKFMDLKEGDYIKEARTTLPLFMERFCREDKIKCKIIVIVLDTVYAYFAKEKKPPIKYNELKSILRSKYLGFIEENLSEDKKLLWKSYGTIIVAPGVGTFSVLDKEYKVLVVEGHASDYYNYVLYKLVTEILQILKKCKEEIYEKEGRTSHLNIEIILDITHGVNFMPTLTYSILRDISEILSLGGHSVTFMVYNSEPVTRASDDKNKETAEIGIHLIEQYNPKFRPGLIRRVSKNTLYEECSKKIIDKLFKTSEISNKDIKKINGFLMALRNSLLLPLKLTAFDPEKLKTLLEETVKKFIESIEIKCDPPEISTRRKLTFGEGFSSWVLTYLIRNMIEVSQDKELSLKEMDQILEKYFKGWNPAYFIGKVEVEKLKAMMTKDEEWLRDLREEKRMDERKGEKWITLKELEEKSMYKKSKRLRNFVAHGGLLKDCVEVNILPKNGEIERVRLRYKGKEEKKLLEYLERLWKED